MRPRSIFVLLGLVAFAAGAFAAISATSTRGDTPEYTTYAGESKDGENLVVNYSASSQKVDFYGYAVHLQQACLGQTQNLILTDIPVSAGQFDQFDGVQGVNGTYSTTTGGVPIVTGTIYLRQGTDCETGVPYVAATKVVLQGDPNCSWLAPFQVDSVGGAEPQGEPTPAPKDPTQAVTVDDMMAVLRYVAGLPVDAPPACSAIGSHGTQLDPSYGTDSVVADVNCDGKVDGSDAILILNYPVGLPSSTNPQCLKIGKFYTLQQ